MTTAAPLHAVDDTATDAAPMPPVRRSAANQGRAAAHSVYRSPLSTDDDDASEEAAHLRAQRARRTAQLAAVGIAAALTAVALIAWRRARR